MIFQVYLGGGIILLVSIIITYCIAYNTGWKDRDRLLSRVEFLRGKG